MARLLQVDVVGRAQIVSDKGSSFDCEVENVSDTVAAV